MSQSKLDIKKSLCIMRFGKGRQFFLASVCHIKIYINKAIKSGMHQFGLDMFSVNLSMILVVMMQSLSSDKYQIFNLYLILSIIYIS